jgi:glycosyltransferase involved in cell wall biosynthesis
MAPRILIGTPCYGGNMNVNYFHSIRKLLPALEKKGIEFHIKTLSQESLITRARNTIVAEFLGRKDFTHLLFIDADMGFEPGGVLRLLARGEPLVCGACPMKGYDWEKVLAAAKKADSADALKRASLKFAINLTDEDRPRGARATKLAVEDGFVKVSKAGSAMMLIERQVFERMKKAYPELKYRNDITGYENQYSKDNFWSFFETMVHPKSRRYLSEDYAFCHRWTSGCGGEIWLDVQSRISHYGSVAYSGSFLEGVGKP